MMVLNLDPDWPDFTGHSQAKVEKFVFPGGEPHVKLAPFPGSTPDEILLRHRLNSSQNIMELLLAADACRRQWPGVELNAYIPYIPFGRQDRPMVSGEPFSLKATMASTIAPVGASL